MKCHPQNTLLLRLAPQSKTCLTRGNTVYLHQVLWCRDLACSQETKRFGESDGRAAIVHTELAIDIGGMHLDRTRRDHQFALNLLVGEGPIDHAQAVQLAC